MFFLQGRSCLLVFACLIVLCPGLSWATDSVEDSQNVPSPSNYGGAGLLDMRTARFYPEGYLVPSVSNSKPDNRYAITFQALPWAEFTFRYTIIRAEQLYDRSFDLKLRLSNETEFFPELALGLQDIIGTGVYSGEYLVGTKRWGPLDFTLGLGWGRLGSRGTFENPFGLISKGFLSRIRTSNEGGIPLFSSYFRGPDVGLFGGIEYQTPIDNLTLKVEYSSDSYLQEKQQIGKDYGFPLNVGVSYRPFPWLDIGLSLMHGNSAGLRISALIDAEKENWQARLDPPPRFRARPEQTASTILQREAQASAPANGSPETHFVDLTAGRSEPGNEHGPTQPDTAITQLSLPNAAPPQPGAVAQSPLPNPAPLPPALGQLAQGQAMDTGLLERIKLGLADQKLTFLGAAVEGAKITIIVENTRYRRDTEAIARTARILSGAATADIDYFEITLARVGQPLATVTLPRSEIDQLARREGSADELFEASELAPGLPAPLDHVQPGLFPQFDGLLYPVFRQSLFDPNNPFYFMFGLGATGEVRLARGWFVTATAVGNIYNTFNQISRVTNSVLPHVRSDVADYLKKEKIGLENVSTSYYFKLAPEIFGRVSAGYLEQMFAGAGGELLYRPFAQRWAIGMDLWTVRQRGFDVLLDLRHYQAVTGHLSLYYELPWHDVQVTLSAGQYLAGDKGATFALSRRFSTGVQVGMWFTLTNVSAARFGEGSFDKGIRIVIPFEWVAPFATQSGYDLSLRAIQRDGGQRLLGDAILYDMIYPSSYGALTQEWNSVFK
jgi:hypothetical protein